MLDTISESTLLLQRLVQQVMKEQDPLKYDQLAADIRHVLDVREHLKAVVVMKEKMQDQSPAQF
jgi:hypothetical protein